MSAGPTILVAPEFTRIADASMLLRTLVQSARSADHAGSSVRSGPSGEATTRTWAILGEFATDADLTENERVIEHDRLGRQAVRLAVDKVLCVGSARSVRALHQGAVMEGSWGDEVRLAISIEEAEQVLRTDPQWRPAPGDSVLVAGVGVHANDVATIWREEFGYDPVVVVDDQMLNGQGINE